jgi:hypothetical protein
MGGSAHHPAHRTGLRPSGRGNNVLAKLQKLQLSEETHSPEKPLEDLTQGRYNTLEVEIASHLRTAQGARVQNSPRDTTNVLEGKRENLQVKG